MHWLRAIGAVIAGMFVGCILVACCEGMGHVLFPLPAGTSQDIKELTKLIEEGKINIPVGSLLFVLLGWLSGAGVGSWVAARLSNWGKMACGFIVGAFIFTSSVMMLLMIPHPLMFSMGALLLVPLASYFGTTAAIPMPAESK